MAVLPYKVFNCFKTNFIKQDFFFWAGMCIVPFVGLLQTGECIKKTHLLSVCFLFCILLGDWRPRG